MGRTGLRKCDCATCKGCPESSGSVRYSHQGRLLVVNDDTIPNGFKVTRFIVSLKPLMVCRSG